MKKILIFFITTISGFYIGSGVSITLNNIFPKFFAVDPNFIQKVFSNKPTITSEILGYLEDYIFSKMQNFRFNKSFAWKTLYFLSAFVGILTVAGFLGRFSWVFDTVCHFRAQYFFILMLNHEHHSC